MRPEDVAACWEGNAEAWTRLVRAGHDRYRDTLNTPAFLAMLPPVAGLAGLDLGCGEGANTRALARLGARMTGIDVAPTFVRHAEEAEAAEPLGIPYRVADAAALPFPDGSFAFATAFMSLMDMPDQAAALAEARRVLAPGGFLQFSILHPCFVPPHHRNIRDAEGRVVALEVGRYFEELDGDIETWIFSTVPPEERATTPPFRTPRFHRTLSRWVEMVVAAGFLIEAMGEPRATEAEAAAEPVVADTRNAPIFLHVRCRKPG
ncbi:class I SAM-dependent methyltransferase [Salinarimonas rosea]|uniref:class I SAM-dependent methyltransferase n=1 Tax=Salinarimonas rosea TaxID=552063 RepID=UPI000413C4E7|nr:class I SAM-dependent methyltransferase [Salinarimonas rosea]